MAISGKMLAQTSVSSQMAVFAEYSLGAGNVTALTELDSTNVALVYSDNTQVYLRIGVKGSTGITWGSLYVAASPGAMSYVDICQLTSTSFAITYGSSVGVYARVCTISGTVITVGAASTSSATTSYPVGITALSSSLIVVSYNDAGATNYGTCQAGTISGTTITFGSKYVFSSTNTGANSSCDNLTATTFVCSKLTINTTQVTSYVGTVSGTTISYGAGGTLSMASLSYNVTTASINATHIAFYAYTGNSMQFAIGTVSAGAVSWGSLYTVDSRNCTNSVLKYMGNNTIAMGDRFGVVIATLDGSYVPTFGSRYAIFSATDSTYYTNYPAICALSSTSLQFGYMISPSSTYIDAVTCLTVTGTTITADASVTTIATGVTGGKTDITCIEVFNPSSVACNFYIYYNGNTDPAMLRVVSIAARGSTPINLGGNAWVLAAGITLKAASTSAMPLYVTVFGIERT